jgi:hypothetical protein
VQTVTDIKQILPDARMWNPRIGQAFDSGGATI